MMKPLISICVPAYNHEAFVQTCLRSVLAQDYRNIELLVADDGSTDGTWGRLCALRADCERRFVRTVMYSRENRGCARTLAELYALAKGDLVGEIASDDAYLPGAIASLAEPFCGDAALGLSVGVNILVDSEGRRCFWDDGRNVVHDASRAAYLTFDDWLERRYGMSLDSRAFGDYGRLLRGNHVPNGSLKRRALLAKIVPYDRQAPLEDWWFHLQFSKIAKYRHIPKETFCYRWHGGNTAHNQVAMLDMARRTLLREYAFVRETGDLPSVRRFQKAIPVFKRAAFSLLPAKALWRFWRRRC